MNEQTPAEEPPLNLLRRIRTEAPRVAEQLLRLLPELRSVAIVFDWQGALNESAPAGIWLDHRGVVGSRDNPAPRETQALIQTLRLLEVQQTVIRRRIARLDRELQGRTQLLEQVTEALDDRESRLQATRQEFPGPSRGSGDAAGSAPSTPDSGS